MKNTIKIESKGHTQMIAHRGVSGLEPENTNAAFVAAGNRSYYGIESDVHKTADGKYVIIHDGNTMRTAGVDLEIGKATYEALCNVQLLQMDGSLGRMDLRIPTLQEYLGICKYYGKNAILELKDAFTAEEIDEICTITESLDYMQNTVFISFKLNNLLLLKARNPEQRVQFLIERGLGDEMIRALAKSDMGIDAYYPAYTEELIQKCRQNGVETNTWTVDDPEIARKLIDWGIDYITSNILE